MQTLLLALLSTTPVELGQVDWNRRFDQAVAEAKKSERPILILFDEVPGCATCVRYGESVLSDPLLVEAAETLFVPVAIYNNVGGHDREVLKRFKEPTWNNPVVRIVDANGDALSRRVSGDYTKGGLARAMVAALQRAGRPVPGYLSLLQQEYSAPQQDRAVFSMYCFWTGEACLGNAPGVVSTRTGFAGGREVVEVTYDTNLTSADALAARKCGRLESAERIQHSPKDDKYQLKHTAWRSVSMTALQASRANALLAQRQDPRALFSPRQIQQYEAALAKAR